VTRPVSATGETLYPYGRRRAAPGSFVPRKGRAMEKGLTYAALGVAALMLLIFLLDMIAGFPFGGGSFAAVDVMGIIASGVVGYLAWNTMRDLK
jgi:hypothetical protein